MADGQQIYHDAEAADLDAEREKSAFRLWIETTLAYRQTPFIVAALVIFLGLAAIAILQSFGLTLLSSEAGRMAYATGWAMLALPLLLLLRDAPNDLGKGPQWPLPTACLIILIAMTCGFAFQSEFDIGEIMGAPEGLVFFVGLTLVLVPLIWNSANFWRYHQETIADRYSADETTAEVAEEQQEAEAMSALIATLVATFLLGFMLALGQYAGNLNLNNTIGIVLSGVVVTVFFIVIFIDTLSNFTPVKMLARTFRGTALKTRWLASLYRGIDSLLVRIGAGVAGMEHRSVGGRYLTLITLLICFATLGWCLEPPFGFIAGFIGLILALSVSRLWSWVEDDRALASLTKFDRNAPYRTDMREDYRDETLLGFVFVFALMPILMYQAHSSPWLEGDIFAGADNSSLWDWIGFFGVELAKAIPLVDWIDIYQPGNSDSDGAMITPKEVAAKHAVFLARATVDLVLIAALIQAINISSRNRQQKLLYNTGVEPKNWFDPGLIDRLDVFVERAELEKAVYATRQANAPPLPSNAVPSPAEASMIHFDLSVLSAPHLIDFRRYNEDRLLELYAGSSNVPIRAFIAAIACERPGFTLKSSIELLEEYAEQQRGEYELYKVLSRLQTDLKNKDEVRGFTLEALRAIMFDLRATSGLLEFKSQVLDLTKQTKATQSDQVETLATIAGLSDPDDFQGVRVVAIRVMADIACDHRDKRLTKQVRDLMTKIRPTARTTVRTAIQNARYRLNDLRYD